MERPSSWMNGIILMKIVFSSYMLIRYKDGPDKKIISRIKLCISCKLTFSIAKQFYAKSLKSYHWNVFEISQCKELLVFSVLISK